jgi:hypothetical protein
MRANSFTTMSHHVIGGWSRGGEGEPDYQRCDVWLARKARLQNIANKTHRKARHRGKDDEVACVSLYRSCRHYEAIPRLASFLSGMPSMELCTMLGCAQRYAQDASVGCHALGVRFARLIFTPREDSSGHAQLALIHQEMEGLVGVLLNSGPAG